MSGPEPAFFFLDAGGHRLRAKAIGQGSADRPVLVFLHEGLGSIPQWRDFPDALAAACGLPALLYERQGHGGSDPAVLPRPADFIEREAHEVLPAVLQRCGIARPLLVGHSDGGTIALLFAAAFPDVPLACITEAAHVEMEPRTLHGLAEVMARWQGDADFRRRLAVHHGAGTEAMVRGWAETWTQRRRDWSMLERLSEITCPLLAIQGDRDEHGSPAQLEAIVARSGGPAEAFVVPDCGHVPHHERRDAVLGRMAAFVAGVLAPRRERAPPSR